MTRLYFCDVPYEATTPDDPMGAQHPAAYVIERPGVPFNNGEQQRHACRHHLTDVIETSLDASGLVLRVYRVPS